MAIVDATQHVRKPSLISALLDVAQAVSGVFLVLYMWGHMTLVSSVLLGADVMNKLAAFMEATFLVQFGGVLVGVGFMVHFVLASRKIPFQLHERKSIMAHLEVFKHTDTKLWLFQAVSAMIILFMGFAHMWVVMSDLPITAATSAARIQGNFWLIFYLILLPLVELHVGVGLYRVAIKWGYISAKARRPWHSFENIVSAFFIIVGLANLYTFYLVIPVTH